MAPDSYIGNLCMIHDDLSAFISQNPGHPLRNEQGRSKLKRLSLAQFNELCVDVVDELRRRRALALLQDIGNFDELNALPPLPSMHPKRNSARQKLSTMTIPSFVMLCANLVSEIDRRFAYLAQHQFSLSPNDEPPPGYSEIIEEEPPPRYSRTTYEIQVGMVVPETWI